MKSFLLALLVAPAAAFVASPAARTGTVVLLSAETPASPSDRGFDGATPLPSTVSSRRAAFGSIRTSAVVAAAAFVASSSSLLLPPSPASAIDTYLTEPTEEFKESERQRMEFRKKQLTLKADFVKVLARLTGESTTEEELVGDLKALKSLVTETGGLPLGIKKEDMYKVIRSKKAKGFWPTNVEIA
jgi:hypothetical protein